MSQRLFAEHIYDLCNRPGYYSTSWKPIDSKKLFKGAIGHFMDVQGRIIVIRILHGPGYPLNPPKVVSSPPIRDLCWDSKGELHFAMTESPIKKKDPKFVWRQYIEFSNPLIYIVDEITEKYRAY